MTSIATSKGTLRTMKSISCQDVPEVTLQLTQI